MIFPVSHPRALAVVYDYGHVPHGPHVLRWLQAVASVEVKAAMAHLAAGVSPFRKKALHRSNEDRTALFMFPY